MTILAAACLAWLALLPCAGSAPATALAPKLPPTAALGIELPTIGIEYDLSWPLTYRNSFNPAIMRDIRDNLQANYVRTGWIPNWSRIEHIRWHREDQVLDAACGAGLNVMIIVPGVIDDSKGVDDLVESVTAFFARYTAREFGCLKYAEIVNEADLPVNGYRDAGSYASYYERIAPVVASFGVTVLTSGVSGEKTQWTAALAALLRGAVPPPPVGGFGFHPYGVPAASLYQSILAMRNAAGALPDGRPSDVYVTEIGATNPDDLYNTIVNLGHATPALTIYEYQSQPGEKTRYGLKDNPALYAAVQKAWARVRSYGVPADAAQRSRSAAI